MDEKMSEVNEDFVWRFKLTPPSEPEASEDPLIEMVRTFLADFLSIGFLTKGGKRIDADGFVFLKDPQSIHEIFTGPAKNNPRRIDA